MQKIKIMLISVLTLHTVVFSQPDIEFRNPSGGNQTTRHYGNLILDPGNYNPSSNAILDCRSIRSYGGYYSFFDQPLYVFQDLEVWGNKNFMHPHPEDKTKAVKYSAVESGEVLTLDRGLAETQSGRAVIDLPEHFLLVTSDESLITVTLTPERAPVLLYTKEKSKNRIVIHMKDADYEEFGDVQFAYQVTGVRDGFEEEEVIVNVDEEIFEREVSEKRAAYNQKVENRTNRIMQNVKANRH